MMADLARFDTFSALHALTVVAFVLFWLVLISIGRRARGTGMEHAWRAVLCGAILATWVFANGVQLLPPYLVVAQNLPLHPCDIAGLLAPWALWRRSRLLLATLYFWGVGFSMQAILTPDISDGPASLGFWTFWLPHANLSGAACYALVVEKFRPDWRDCAVAYGLALLYLALILPFDLLTGFNYGYVGPEVPLQPTLLDHLGPWPWRIGAIMALAALGFVLLTLPWVSGKSAQNPRSVA
jgi:hypothetical integral membrane protein (TIGR02206 family)